MIKTKLVPRTPSAHEYPLLIKYLLAESLKYEPQHEIVYRDLKRMNYYELNQRIAQLANVLTAAGVEPGDTVAVFDWDSHRYLECFYAIPMMGAILHTINVRLSPAQILYTMNHAEDKVVLLHEDFVPIIEAIKGQLTTVKKFIFISDKVYKGESPAIPTTIDFDGEYENLLSKASQQYEFPDFDENTWATTFYTTGTTGNPKGVYFSHRQLFMHTMAVLIYTGSMGERAHLRATDVYMPITPMFHVHAWGVPYVATMLNIKQVYPGRYEPEILLKLLLAEKVTFSHCVPTILQMLVNSPVAKQVDLSRWRVLIGGAALNKALAKATLDLKIDIIAGYGMSETCPIMSLTYFKEGMLGLPIDEQIDYRVKAGHMAPMVDVRIMDENGKFLPHDGKTIGEVVARSPWMTQGYYKEPEKSEELWRNGWLHTGDIASITADNWIQIADRAKDVIKTGGEWVSSLEIENIISQIEGVAEVAVIGLPDPQWDERPHALVVLKPEYTEKLTAEGVKTHFKPLIDSGKLNKWYIPDKVVFVKEIPKTSVGKIDKKLIRSEMKDLIMNA
ncbi:MAG: fatty acid--CoA ligase [Cytophagales bacterium]|nr:MAG: fatty acid--CoA ligase [Cytophagales bacterium]